MAPFLSQLVLGELSSIARNSALSRLTYLISDEIDPTHNFTIIYYYPRTAMVVKVHAISMQYLILKCWFEKNAFCHY